MKNIIDIQNSIRQLKTCSQQLANQISHIDDDKDISVKFYIANVRKMSLQALDLSNALEKQISLLQNQKRITAQRNQYKGKTK
jgi:hypothetical protein